MLKNTLHSDAIKKRNWAASGTFLVSYRTQSEYYLCRGLTHFHTFTNASKILQQSQLRTKLAQNSRIHRRTLSTCYTRKPSLYNDLHIPMRRPNVLSRKNMRLGYLDSTNNPIIWGHPQKIIRNL